MPAILNNFGQFLHQKKYLPNSLLMQIKGNDDHRDTAQQVCRTLFPCIIEPERKLDVDDESKEDEVNLGRAYYFKESSEVSNLTSDAFRKQIKPYRSCNSAQASRGQRASQSLD